MVSFFFFKYFYIIVLKWLYVEYTSFQYFYTCSDIDIWNRNSSDSVVFFFLSILLPIQNKVHEHTFSYLLNINVNRLIYRAPRFFSGIYVAQSSVFCVVFCTSIFIIIFFFFLLNIILSFLFRLTASDYTFGIFRLYLW